MPVMTPAIYVGPGGQAIIGEVELPPMSSIPGDFEVEHRNPGEYGKWHTAKPGTATVLFVRSGTWRVQVPDGTFRDFVAGDMVVSQDGTVAAEKGHRSQNPSKAEVLVLVKMTIGQLFPQAAA